MKFFGQEIFEIAESLSGNLNDQEYITARQLCLQLTRDDGIDRVMAEHTLDAVLSPSYAFGSSAPAAAGYPIISVPVGLTADGKPAGAWLYAGFLQEPKLISIAYAMEQLLQPRSQPSSPAACHPIRRTPAYARYHKRRRVGEVATTARDPCTRRRAAGSGACTSAVAPDRTRVRLTWITPAFRYSRLNFVTNGLCPFWEAQAILSRSRNRLD